MGQSLRGPRVWGLPPKPHGEPRIRIQTASVPRLVGLPHPCSIPFLPERPSCRLLCLWTLDEFGTIP